MQKWLLGIAGLALLAGCAKAPAPVVVEPVSTTPAAPAPQAPILAAPPVVECVPEPREGKERIDLHVNGASIGSLPARDCTVKAVAGNNLTLRIYPSKGIGLPVQTPTGEGLWEFPGESLMVPAFTVEPGGPTTIKLNLTEQGLGEFTYTFVSREATTYTLASAADRKGPWTPVAGEFIPPQHRWLKIAYSAPLAPDARPDLGLMGSESAPLEWEGDRTAVLSLEHAPTIFVIGAGRDRGGFPARGQVPAGGFFYWSEKPQLMRVTAAGQVTPLYTLNGLPERMHIAEGTFYYQLAMGKGFKVDLATGAESDGPYTVGAHGFGETYVQSPVGGLLADLELPGGWDVSEDRIDPADLVIMDSSHKELDRVKAFMQVHRIVPGCSDGLPARAWRPDGGAVAAVSAATSETLQLVVYDLAAKKRTVLAEKPGDPSGSYWGLSWAPGGRYITFLDQLLDTQTGKYTTSGIAPSVRWNPAGTHLLEKRYSPWVRWQEMTLIEAATGKRTALGYGDTLGWTADGDAIVVRWETGRYLPGPGKSCLP